MSSIGRDVSIKYLGHGTFAFRSPGGKRVLIDPWIEQNPSCPDSDKRLDGIDLMLITHGHFDHLQDAVQLAGQFQPKIACIFEIGHWLEQQGVQNVSSMNKGGSQELEGIRITMVDARHSSGIITPEGELIYAGEPAGYVLEFENGFRTYFAGDTCAFTDMKLIAELHQPELCFLPIGDHYTMGPREAALACRLLGASKVIPMHYATFPILTGRPDELAELTKDIGTEVIALQPGQEIS